jgi:hypothetical protein
MKLFIKVNDRVISLNNINYINMADRVVCFAQGDILQLTSDELRLLMRVLECRNELLDLNKSQRLGRI